MYQVKWFNKKKGYGFASGEDKTEYFCHHTDITVEGYKYLKRGEYISGEVTSMGDGKSKLVKIRSPSEWGQLMCEVERTS
jgi:CspA family cold shock protein